MELAFCLENIVQSLTHETAAELGFMRCHMERVAWFIEFRQRWQNLFPNQSYGKVSRQCGDKV